MTRRRFALLKARDRDAPATIYESMYDKVPKHMTAAYVLRVCENVLWLPGDANWGRGWRRWSC